jgi:transposase
MPNTQPAAFRLEAVHRVLGGEAAAEVAADLGVHRRTVLKWVAGHRAAVEPTRNVSRGRRPKIPPDREGEVLGWLAAGPAASGYGGQSRWLLSQVTDLLRTRLGVQYHPTYLRARLGRHGVRLMRSPPAWKEKLFRLLDQTPTP